MIALFDSVALPTLARVVLAVLLDLTLKGALILALAGVLTSLLKQASAATRHLIWCLALCSVLMLPVLTLTLPSWRLSVLSEVPYLQEATAPLDHASPSRPSSAEGTKELAQVVVTPVVSPTAAVGSVEGVRDPRPVHGVVVGTFSVLYDAVRAAHWTLWLLCLWLGGVAVVLFRFLIGAGGVGWLAYQARLVHDPAWTSLAGEIGKRTGLRRRVRLLRSLHTAMPMTWGVWRPVVLLPVRVEDWSEARRRCVLTHEFAHIKRWDCLTQTLAQVACAISWFNPLVWMAARRLRHERELACDDFVLCGDVRPSDYATHLLEIARTTRTTLLAPLGAVAMARPSQLEGRVLAILDAARKHEAVGRMATLAGVVFTAVLVLPLAAMRPVDPDAASPSDKPVFERIDTEEGEGYRWSGRIDQGRMLDIRGVRGRVQATLSTGSEVEVVALPRDDGFTGEVLMVEQEGAVVVCLPHPHQPDTCATHAWHEIETDDQAEVDSRNGDVAVELPGNAHTDIDLHVEADGHLQTAIDLRRYAREKGERFRGTLGRGGRLLAIHTVDGNITVTYRGQQRLRPLEAIEVRMQDEPTPRARPHRADARSNARKTYAVAEQSRPELKNTPAVEALTDGQDIDADLDLLRLHIGRLDLALTAHLLDMATNALNELDLGVEISRLRSASRNRPGRIAEVGCR